MRVNVYSEELGNEVIATIKESSVTGQMFYGAQIMLESPPELQFRDGEDRSAVTFWFEDKNARNKFAAGVALSLPKKEN